VNSSEISSDTVAAVLASGGTAALTRLAKRLLVGDGIAPSWDKAVELLQQAASRGHAEAAAQLSVCSAWGIGQPRDIQVALRHLEQAASLGRPAAVAELQLLARHGGIDAAELRRHVNPDALTTPPQARVLRERPLILAFERFATPEECRWLIERGRRTLQPARVYQQSATPQTSESRTNTEADLTIFRADVLLSLVRERIARAARAPLANFEVTKLLHYAPGEQFAEHADFIEPRTPELVREIEVRGQRAATALVYLNDGYEGGATHFPRLGLSFRGKCGDALLFSNIDPAGAPDYDTVHAGMPPTSGEKWLLSQWIRTKAVTA
jgi:prolyl 4-hydroxylase